MMRLVDALLVFPGLILTLALTSALGANLQNTMFSLGIVYSPIVARVVRVGVLSVRNRDYVQVTRMFGANASYRMFLHVLPSVMHATVVLLTLMCGLSVLAHGVTAAPLATRYADWLGRHPRGDVEVETGAGAPGLRWRLAHEEQDS